MSEQAAQAGLEWQSKLILLLVVPWTAISVVLQSYWWLQNAPIVAWTTLGISSIFGLIVWKMRAGTPAAAATGATITASLMYSTTDFPYTTSWYRGGLTPLLTVFLLTYAATKIGRKKKERLRLAEDRKGRNSAQVAANLGAAALLATNLDGFTSLGSFPHLPMVALIVASVALAEAAADTVSSEIGQSFGGQPRLVITLRRVPIGTDGAITLIGTVAGTLAACIVMSAVAIVDAGFWVFSWAVVPGAIFGLFFDTLLGATAERKGWLNNDGVNFISTLSAAVFSAVVFAVVASISHL